MGGRGWREWSLARLIRRWPEIDGLERIRFTTSHPNDMERRPDRGPWRLRQADALPASAGAGGSDRVLKAMNRKHTAESYVRLIERIRAARPDLALSGDFIVGFPGETEADFQATLDLVEEVGYGQRLFLQVFRPPRHPRRRTRAGRPGRGQ
jgi:tRNA-2-methylthio-N6-dimethylallyladenosine synthase